jgi:hypothetical protein
MTKKQFLEHHGNKRLKEIAGILHIYLSYECVEKHQELENHIMINETMKVKDALSKIEHLLEFEQEK